MKNLSKLFSSVMLLCIFMQFSCKKTENQVQSADNKKNNAIVPSSFKVIGYQSSDSTLVNSAQAGKLTHAIYTSVYLNGDGSLQPLENPSKLQTFVNNKLSFPLLHVLISVTESSNGGGDFSFMCSSSSTRSTFIQNISALLLQYNLDGVEINWQYPTRGDGTSADRENFALLLKELRSVLRPDGKLLTIQAGGSSLLIQSSYDVPAISLNIDWVSIEGYNDNPLLPLDFAGYSYADNALTNWSNAGLPNNKAVLLLPFFGKGAVALPLFQLSYKNIINRGGNPLADIFGVISYNGIQTVKRKTNLAFDRASGVAVLKLSDDATGLNSLLDAINNVVIIRTGENVTPPPYNTVITLKGTNGKYVTNAGGLQPLFCNQTTAGNSEKFTVEDAGNGKIALKSLNGYVSSGNGIGAVTGNKVSIGDWEKFEWIVGANGKVALRGNNGRFISSENGNKAMTCTRITESDLEYFSINQ